MDETRKTTAAIVVDYDYYRSTPQVRDWVAKREGQATLIALVSSPDAEHPEDFLNTDCEWDIVITNPKGNKDRAFKSNALHVLKSSNTIPVIALDLFNEDIYRAHDVLMVVTL